MVVPGTCSGFRKCEHRVGTCRPHVRSQRRRTRRHRRRHQRDALDGFQRAPRVTIVVGRVSSTAGDDGDRRHPRAARRFTVSRHLSDSGRPQWRAGSRRPRVRVGSQCGTVGAFRVCPLAPTHSKSDRPTRRPVSSRIRRSLNNSKGTVTNTSAATLTDIELVVAIYDGSGNVAWVGVGADLEVPFPVAWPTSGVGGRSVRHAS